MIHKAAVFNMLIGQFLELNHHFKITGVHGSNCAVTQQKPPGTLPQLLTADWVLRNEQ